jgi:O-antigen/teichoic acid export membrane protein
VAAGVIQAARKLMRIPFSGEAMVGRLEIQAGWVVLPFAVQQGVRLITNIILARLLAPEMFGLMLIVNTLRTGTELLSDIGIGQSVVRTKRELDTGFLDTAWTLQVIRGALLTALMMALVVPVSNLYGHELKPILFAVSGIFLLSGLQSPALFLMQRNVELRQRAAYDIASTVFQCALTIALAFFIPSVWALVWGLMLSTVFSTALSYAFGARRMPRLTLHRAHVHELIHFGKWVFFATAIYFAATSTDRAFFAAALPLALVGVYSVARTFSDMMAQLAQRLGSFLVFPKIAGLKGHHQAAADRVRRARRRALLLIAVGTGVAIAASDAFILLCYDERYHGAAFMLPLLIFGVWFGVLGTFAEAILLGCDRPAPGALANLAKFAVLLVALPLALAWVGIPGALLALALAECARWVILGQALARDKLAFFGDDVALTALLIGTAIVTKFVLGFLGVVPTLAEWWSMGSGLHG